MTVREIADEALALPIEARALLANQLLESLDDPTEENVRQSWAAEIKRRADDVRGGRVETIPGDEVMAEAKRIAST